MSIVVVVFYVTYKITYSVCYFCFRGVKKTLKKSNPHLIVLKYLKTKSKN